jgi:hypothetical protein
MKHLSSIVMILAFVFILLYAGINLVHAGIPNPQNPTECIPCADMTSCPDSDCQAAENVIKRDHKKGRKEIIDFIGKSHGKDGVGGSGQFKKFEDWYGKRGGDGKFKSGFVPEHIIRAMQMMTEQLSAVAHQQVLATGNFFDALSKLKHHRKFQTLVSEAHKDYHPSRDFCNFGTNVRSLAHTDRLAHLNKQGLHKRQMARHLGTAPTINTGVAGAADLDDDRESRWKQFLEQYCDPRDNNHKPDISDTGLDAICTGHNAKRVNRDIDFTRLVEYPRTLDVNFTDGGAVPSADEEDVLALSNNLYGHDVLSRNVDEDLLRKKSSQEWYLALRTIAAKRGVAENSFNAIVALKAAGTTDVASTRDFLGAIIKELGITDDSEIYALIGENPSYYAQLELLAKKLYQNPDFYAELYDKPANVKRKSTALKAIELMVDRAIYESQLRREMATSILLSARLQSTFDNVNDSQGTSPTGK